MAHLKLMNSIIESEPRPYTCRIKARAECKTIESVSWTVPVEHLVIENFQGPSNLDEAPLDPPAILPPSALAELAEEARPDPLTNAEWPSILGGPAMLTPIVLHELIEEARRGPRSIADVAVLHGEASLNEILESCYSLKRNREADAAAIAMRIEKEVRHYANRDISHPP